MNYTPEQDMQRSINALYLELPEVIVKDVQQRFNAYKEAASQSFTAQRNDIINSMQLEIDRLESQRVQIASDAIIKEQDLQRECSGRSLPPQSQLGR